jgi:APA family basic amino acid/polyamine antiporter
MRRKPAKLLRSLSLFDATSIGVGAIIGAGIFVILGVATSLAGPAVLLSVLIAGVCSVFTALSFSKLSSAIPKEGGAYEYAFELFSPFIAFLTGWMWIFAQIVVGATVSIGLATYLALFIPLPVNLVAAGACLVFALVNLVGVKESATVNNALVVFKVAALLLFIAVGASHIQLSNFQPFLPNGFSGVISGAALIFFAYLGFGRIAIVSEEVKNPEKTLPLSILLALGISAVLYLLVSFTAVGVSGPSRISASGSPLADAMKITGNDLATTLVSLGAIFAIASVLLTTILGVSRVSFSMARNRQIPDFINSLHPSFGTPYVSILLTGLLMAALALTGNLLQVASIASFSIIVTHVLVNYAAIAVSTKQPKFRIPFYPLPPVLGIISCAALALSLLPGVWVAEAVVLCAGVAFYAISNTVSRRVQGKNVT